MHVHKWQSIVQTTGGDAPVIAIFRYFTNRNSFVWHTKYSVSLWSETSKTIRYAYFSIRSALFRVEAQRGNIPNSLHEYFSYRKNDTDMLVSCKKILEWLSLVPWYLYCMLSYKLSADILITYCQVSSNYILVYT